MGNVGERKLLESVYLAAKIIIIVMLRFGCIKEKALMNSPKIYGF